MIESLAISCSLGAMAIVGLGMVLAGLDMLDVGESRAVEAIERGLAVVVALPVRAITLIVQRSR